MPSAPVSTVCISTAAKVERWYFCPWKVVIGQQTLSRRSVYWFPSFHSTAAAGVFTVESAGMSDTAMVYHFLARQSLALASNSVW